jgi:hypothetical protein
MAFSDGLCSALPGCGGPAERQTRGLPDAPERKSSQAITQTFGYRRGIKHSECTQSGMLGC